MVDTQLSNRKIRKGDEVRVVGGGDTDPAFVGMRGVVVKTGYNTRAMFGGTTRGRTVTVDFGALRPYVVFEAQSVERVMADG